MGHPIREINIPKQTVKLNHIYAPCLAGFWHEVTYESYLALTCIKTTAFVCIYIYISTK